MRHTFASYAANNVMPTALLQRFLGHQDLKSTEEYMHATVEDIANALGKGDYTKLAQAPAESSPTESADTEASGGVKPQNFASANPSSAATSQVSDDGGNRSLPARKAG
jgi:hypothetical protein